MNVFEKLRYILLSIQLILDQFYALELLLC